MIKTLRACALLCLSLTSTAALAQDPDFGSFAVETLEGTPVPDSKGLPDMGLSPDATPSLGLNPSPGMYPSAGGATAAGLQPSVLCSDGCVTRNYSFRPGWFAGIGGSFNSVKLDQSFGGTATSNVYTDSRLVDVGAAGGPAPPFHSTLTTFAPVAQLGYFRDSGFHGWNWGGKFTYKYLGLTFSDQNIDAPQTGSFTSTTNPPTTTPFTGNATALSAQTSVNHELALMPFIGRSFTSGRVYLGGGPVVFETQQRVYSLQSHADIGGTPTNIGGAPLNLSGNSWMWGGAWQTGVVYYLRPTCFLDFSYDFMVTGAYTSNFPTSTVSQNGSTTYVSQINYSIIQRVWAQSLNCTLNWTF